MYDAVRMLRRTGGLDRGTVDALDEIRKCLNILVHSTSDCELSEEEMQKLDRVYSYIVDTAMKDAYESFSEWSAEQKRWQRP